VRYDENGLSNWVIRTLRSERFERGLDSFFLNAGPQEMRYLKNRIEVFIRER
jgi:hypothetical protein